MIILKNPLYKKIRDISQLLSSNIKNKAKLLVIISLASSIIEAASLSIALPMFSMWMSIAQSNTSPYITKILSLVGVKEQEELLTALITIFIILTTVGGGMRVWLIKHSAIISSQAGTELAEKIFERILSQSYEYSVQRNSSELISILTDKISTVSGLLLSIISFFNAIVMLIFIWIGLLWVNVKAILLITVFFILIYSYVMYLTRKKIDHNSRILSVDAPRLLKELQETFGSIRDIIFSGTQKIYQDSFTKLSLKIKMTGAENILMSQSPRYIVETIGLVVLATLAYFFQDEKNSTLVLPMLGVLAIGAQRMLPAVQIIYSSYLHMKLSHDTLSDVLEVMELPKVINDNNVVSKNIQIIKEVKLENISFQYANNTSNVIKNFNFSFVGGECFAVVGPSGVGKSTFLDLLSGLLSPVSGNIYINGIPLTQKNMSIWRAGISYVPQNIFIIDASIAENIAFGIAKDQIDMQKVKKASQLAEISDYIQSLKEGYMTRVGERGFLISGGQRQRIGIARAIYRDPKLLIIDEATNALDHRLEKLVLQNLRSIKPDLTILHVTHRIDVAKTYNFILEFTAANVLKINKN